MALLASLEAPGLVIHELLDGAKLQRVRDFDAFAARYEGRRYTNIVGLRPSS